MDKYCYYFENCGKISWNLENRTFKQSLLENFFECISQNSLKRTFEEFLFYLSRSLVPYWKKLYHKCFSVTFQKSYSMERWWTAVSEGIGYKTKTKSKGSTDHKNTITFEIKTNWRHTLNLFTVVLILKPAFTEVIKNIKATYFMFAEMLWALAEHGSQGLKDGRRIIGQGVGGRINLIACDYISSVKQELLVYWAKIKTAWFSLHSL